MKQLRNHRHHQPRLPAWAELVAGDGVVAAAILDRLLDNATVINIKGPSWHYVSTKPSPQPITQTNTSTDTPRRRRG